MPTPTRLLLALLFLNLGYANESVSAQQIDSPGVTDITSITATSSLDSASFSRWLATNWRDSTYFVQQVTNQLGTVTYRPDLKAYVISSLDPNGVYTPDTAVCGQWTGIVYTWPGASRWNNKTVQIDGRYFQARGVKLRYGGEQIFYLHLTDIR